MRRQISLSVLPIVLCGALTAQGKDLRDVVRVTSGKEVRGRVVQDFDPEEVLVLQGGKRVRIPRDKVVEMNTVRARVFELLDRRTTAKRNVRYHWALAEWAQDRELDRMARLQALTVLELDDTHEDAHRMLGHKQHKKRGWLWPLKSRFVTRERYEEHIADIGHPLELESEHFRIHTDGGIHRAVEALIDLERLYRYWFATWGERLRLQECLDPMDIQVWNDQDDFSGWTSFPKAYFVPNPYADRSYTFFEGANERPSDLFFVGTQHLLYACLAGDADPGGEKERFCDWVEIGLGQWIQARMGGEAGFAELRPHRLDQWEADAAYVGQLHNGRYRRVDLPNVLHWTLRTHFYGSVYHRNQSRNTFWASAHMFVAFLMDQSVDPKNAERLIDYVRVALADAKGDSSKAFDEAMGTRIEKLEQPFRRWLQDRATPGARR